MFEHKSEKVLPLPRFYGRLARSFLWTASIVSVALSLGVVGYHEVAGLDWTDALLEASMILTGMGPVNPLTTNAAKLFASGYALFSGLIFITVMAVVLSPVLHRMLHKLHIDEGDFKKDR
jgi:hypothetical protein